MPDDDDSTPVPDDDDATPPPDDDDAIDTFEGDEVGECEDGVDNDNDLLFDCDDPTCNGDPVCGAADDDDDATAPSDGTPLITSLTGTWLASTSELEFSIVAIDSDCDVGQPVLGWSFNGVPQGSVTLGTNPTACTTNITFWVEVSPGPTYEFVFTVSDAAGNMSAPEAINISAS